MADNNESCRAKLLIINDEPSLMDLLAESLKNLGYYHEVVNSDREAKKRLKYEDFDAVMRGHEFFCA